MLTSRLVQELHKMFIETIVMYQMVHDLYIVQTEQRCSYPMYGQNFPIPPIYA